MLPAGDLGEHQQPQLIARVDKILALGVMAGAHGIAAKLLLQNAGVLPLKGFRGGIADVGVALMAVQAAEEGFFAVEVEAVRPELRGAEAESGLLPIQLHPVRGQEAGLTAVKIGPRRVPGLGVRNIGLSRRAGPHGFPRAVQNGDLQRCPIGRAVGGHLDVCRGQRGCGNINVGDVSAFPHIQPRLPVQPAIGEVVHHKTKRRDGWVFAGIQLHSQQVGPARLHQLCHFYPEGGVAAAVSGRFHAVDVHRSNVGSAVQLKEQPLARQSGGDVQRPAVTAQHLIGLRIDAVQGQLLTGVGQADSSGFAAPGRKFVAPPGGEFPAVAQAISHRLSS